MPTTYRNYPLSLEGLRNGFSIFVETDSPRAKKPVDQFKIRTPGEQPVVKIIQIDGLSVVGPYEKLIGSCTRDEWDSRGGLVVPSTTKIGFVVPGERYLLQELGGNAVNIGHAAVVGWAIVEPSSPR